MKIKTRKRKNQEFEKMDLKNRDQKTGEKKSEFRKGTGNRNSENMTETERNRNEWRDMHDNTKQKDIEKCT